MANFIATLLKLTMSELKIVDSIYSYSSNISANCRSFSSNTKKKDLSPLMKSATQNGLGIPFNLNASLLIGTKLGKAVFNLSDNPKLSMLFILTISNKPFLVK